ncbi:MAG: hypothetical protein J0M36_01755 [Caulobacterales bacterium]|nr:hypothetical protein [Caulobacterales bacterium]
MFKLILGVVVGVVVVMALVVGGEFALHALFPIPMPDPNDAEAAKAAMANAPMGAKIGLIVVYFIAAAGAGFVAAKVAARRLAGWITAGIMAALTIANFFMLPHPVWIVAASLILIAAGGWLGARAGTRA